MTDISFEQLIEEHDHIERTTFAVANLVAGPVADMAVVGDRIGQLAEEVASHLAHENDLFYPAIARLRRGGSEADAIRVTEAFEALRSDWAAYIGRWAHGPITGELGRLRGETAEMLPRLRERLRFETELLYAASLRDGIITLRRTNLTH